MNWRSEPGFWLAVLIVALRVLVIDMDPPVLPITYHLAKDESFYTALAMDLYEHGRVFPDGPKGLFGIPYLTNGITYVGLVGFGKTYLGLRIGTLVLGLIGLFLFQALLRRITTDHFLRSVLPLLLVVDIQFTFATIVVEPTMSRIVMTLLTMLWVIGRSGTVTLPGWVVTGFLLFFSVVVTYPSNGFILFAVPLVQVWEFFGRHQRCEFGARVLLPLVCYGAGMVLAVVAYFRIPLAFSIDEYAFLFERGDEYTTRVGLTLAGLARNVMTIPSGGIFRFHPAMLLLLLLSLMLVPMKRFQTWSRPVAVVYLFCAAFLLQCVVLNDFPLRKLTFLLPLVLLLAAALYEHWSNPDEQKGQAGWLVRNRFVITAVACVCVAVQTVFYYRLSTSETPLVLHSSLMGFACLLLVFILIIAGWKAWLPVRTWWFLFVGVMLLPGLANTYLHVLRNPTHFHRDFMVGMNRFGDARFIGGWSMGFRLYNSVDAVVNPYQYRGAPIQVWDVVRDFAEADPRINYSIGIEEDRPFYEERGFTEHERVDMRYPDGTVESYIIFVEPR